MSAGTNTSQQRIDYRLEINLTVIVNRARSNAHNADLIAALIIAFLIVKFLLLHFYWPHISERLNAIQGKKAAINLRKQTMVFFSQFSQT